MIGRIRSLGFVRHVELSDGTPGFCLYLSGVEMDRFDNLLNQTVMYVVVIEVLTTMSAAD